MNWLKGLILLIFVVATLIGWLVQFINSQNHPPPPARRRRENDQASGKVRNEIEQFLDEARRSRQGLPPRQVPPSAIEVVEPARRPPADQRGREEVWREQTQGRRQAQQPARPQQQQRKQAKKQQPRPAVAQQPRQARPPQPKPASSPRSDAQTGVSQHVQQQMSERIGKGVAAHLPHAIDSNVQSHLGSFTADAEDSLGNQGMRQTKIRKSLAANDLGQLLRSRQGVRNAILINEILGPPLSRRPRS